MAFASTPQFYAVKLGRQPGVYKNRTDALKQTINFLGSKMKAFSSFKKAKLDDNPSRSSVKTKNGQRRNTSKRREGAKETADSRAGKALKRNAISKKIVRQPGYIVTGSAAPTPAGHALTEAALERHNLSMTRTSAIPALKPSVIQKKKSEDGWITVYTDGACLQNGVYGAKAGLGVWWGEGKPNLSERVPGAQTNNRGELMAIIRALEDDPTPNSPLCVRTDSMYAINCIDTWAPAWRRNGWRTSGGDPVANLGIIQWLIALIYDRPGPVRLKYVKAHCGITGNDKADKLAKAGRQVPWRPDRDWTIRTHDQDDVKSVPEMHREVQLSPALPEVPMIPTVDECLAPITDDFLLPEEILFMMEVQQIFD